MCQKAYKTQNVNIVKPHDNLFEITWVALVKKWRDEDESDENL